MGHAACGRVELIELSMNDGLCIWKYRDLPMDLADAALARIAERERIRRVFKLCEHWALKYISRPACAATVRGSARRLVVKGLHQLRRNRALGKAAATQRRANTRRCAVYMASKLSERFGLVSVAIGQVQVLRNSKCERLAQRSGSLDCHVCRGDIRCEVRRRPL